MKLALIPPVSLLPWALRTNYQLMLPQLCVYDTYRLFYTYLCADPYQYVILDNGAAEGTLCDTKKLCRIARDYLPQEIVLPDVMGDGPATVEAVKKFMTESQEWISPSTISFGIVATGQDNDEAMRTALTLLELYNDEIETIYIPRLLVKGDPYARIKLATDIESITNKDIHFLGSAPNFPHEIKAAADIQIVRSLDTSMPFVYSYYNRRISDKHDGTGAVRPGSYFQRPSSMFSDAFTSYNIELLLSWANGPDAA